jgi:hypothetical protein
VAVPLLGKERGDPAHPGVRRLRDDDVVALAVRREECLGVVDEDAAARILVARRLRGWKSSRPRSSCARSRSNRLP